jgi:hypothetical protein
MENRREHNSLLKNLPWALGVVIAAAVGLLGCDSNHPIEVTLEPPQCPRLPVAFEGNITIPVNSTGRPASTAELPSGITVEWSNIRPEACQAYGVVQIPGYGQLAGTLFQKWNPIGQGQLLLGDLTLEDSRVIHGVYIEVEFK